MNKETFQKLDRGDIVRHKAIDLATSYIVVANYGNHVTAADVMNMTNPYEWDLIYKAAYIDKTVAFCANCQDPKPGKMVHATIEHTKHRGDIWRCADCGREITSGGSS